MKAEEIKSTAKVFFYKYKKAVIIWGLIILIIAMIHIFGWWEVLAIFFIKFGLGIKVGAAKSLSIAIAKAGGKKALAITTAAMLTKRHLIDVVSKFFIEHSFSKYAHNLKTVAKLKVEEFKETSLVKKIQAVVVAILSIPGIYFFWTKILSVAIQKAVYAFIMPFFSFVIFPILSFIWNIITGFFNVLGFILEVLALNVLLDYISKYNWGKRIVKWIDDFIYFLGDIVVYLNKMVSKGFKLFGINFDPKSWLIAKSIQFNNWLAKILDKGLNKISRVQASRDRYINTIEKISIKRHEYAQVRLDKEVKFIIAFKLALIKKTKSKKLRKKLLESLSMYYRLQVKKELRELRKQKYKIKKEMKKKEKRYFLTLPYQELVRYGDVPGRARGKPGLFLCLKFYFLKLVFIIGQVFLMFKNS